MATEIQSTTTAQSMNWLSGQALSKATWMQAQAVIPALLTPIGESSTEAQKSAWAALSLALRSMPGKPEMNSADIANDLKTFWKPALSDSPAWAIEIAAHTVKREMKWRPTLHEFIQLVSAQVRKLSPWMPLRASEAKSAARLAANPPGTEAWRYDLGVGNDRPELVQRIYFAGKLSEAQLADWCNATHEWKVADLHPNFRAAIKSALAEPQRKAA